MREKATNKQRGHKSKIKVRYLALVPTLALAISTPPTAESVSAAACPDLRVVFARGSGGERWSDQNYLTFKATIESKLESIGLTYDFIDLDYPAVGVGLDNIDVSLGALLGAGEAYEFGRSVKSGIRELQNIVNSGGCPKTKYVLGGYSQGAMVVSKALGGLNADRIIYAATFGDPKIYLPEGKGFIPAACKGENLSNYRMYVPDCQAYIGLLGANIPYEPEAFIDKVGTWCNRRDIFCSSKFDVNDHVNYISDGLYEDASRVIFDKICKSFGIKNHISSPHDTAILIDSTGSMSSMIENYKAEALRLAKETLESGGRVALYDYRDLNDPYDLMQHCDFESCTLERFEDELASIVTYGGGDTPESLLSAAFHTMSSLNWKYGSTKSLVVLTDANFLSPDRDGMSFDEVVALSKQIDPVNFYIITNASCGADYTELANATDGKVVTNFDELSLLTDYIMERYDSLPRVEEDDTARDLPTLEVLGTTMDNNEATIQFKTDGTGVIVALNDTILGTIETNYVTIMDLNPEEENILTLIPLGDGVRGMPTEVVLNKPSTNKEQNEEPRLENAENNVRTISKIKAPKTGQHQSEER